MSSITNDQQKELLLLADSKWRTLRTEMRAHYKLGTDLTTDHRYLLALTNEQWHTLEAKLADLRYAHRDKLSALRKKAKAEASRLKKREYMRQYMHTYRTKKEQTNGQGSRESGS